MNRPQSDTTTRPDRANTIRFAQSVAEAVDAFRFDVGDSVGKFRDELAALVDDDHSFRSAIEFLVAVGHAKGRLDRDIAEATLDRRARDFEFLA